MNKIENKEDFIKYCVELDKDTNEYKLNVLGVIYIVGLTHGLMHNNAYAIEMIRKLLNK